VERGHDCRACRGGGVRRNAGGGQCAEWGQRLWRWRGRIGRCGSARGCEPATRREDEMVGWITSPRSTLLCSARSNQGRCECDVGLKFSKTMGQGSQRINLPRNVAHQSPACRRFISWGALFSLNRTLAPANGTRRRFLPQRRVLRFFRRPVFLRVFIFLFFCWDSNPFSARPGSRFLPFIFFARFSVRFR
jgi:hypothetical protein